MAAKNEARIRFIAETSEFNSQIKQANQSMTELRSELRLSQARFRDNANSVEALTDKKRILQQQLAATANKVEALRQKLERAKNIYGDNSEEVSRLRTQLNNAERQYAETENAIEDVNRQLNNQENETEEATDATKKLDKAVDNAGDGFTVFKGVVANLVSEGLSLLVEGLKDVTKYAGEMATEVEAAFDKLQAKTGATSSRMAEYTTVAQDIFRKGWGESVDEVTESIGTVIELLGSDMPTDQLQAVTENAMTCADVFGWDVKESVRAANSLMNQFGITSDEAFNLIVQGAQNGLDQNNDLLDTVNEYSVQFKNAGYSADDMFNMLANGANSGTWSVDKLGDAVKEMNIRMSDNTVGEAIAKNAEALGLTGEQTIALTQALYDGGETGKKAMIKILDGILAIENPTLRYQMGVETFGTMWEDLGEETIAALLKTEGGIDSVNAAMEQVKTDAYDNLNTDLARLSNSFDVLASDIMQEFNGALRTGVQAITGFINGTSSAAETVEGLKSAFTQAIDVIKENLSQFGQVGGELMAALVQGIIDAIPSIFECATNIVTGLLDGLANNMENIFSAGSSIIDKLGEGILSALPKIADSAMRLVDSLGQGIKDNSKKMAEQGLNLVENLVDHIAEYTPKLIENGIGLIRNLVQGITSSLPTLFEKLPTIVSKIANIISDSAPKLIAGGVKIIGDLLIGIIKAIPSLIKNIPKIIKSIIDTFLAFNWLNFGKGLFTKVGDGIKSAATWVKNAAVNVFNTVVNAIKSLPTKLWELAKNGVLKMASGISSTVNSVKTAATNVFNTVINAIKGLPSKLWELAKNAVTKLADGIKSVVNSVKTAATNVFNTVVNAIKGLPAKLLELGKNAITKLADGIKNVVSKVKTAITNVFNTIINTVKGLPSKLWELAKNAVTKLADGIKNGISKVKTAITNVFNTVVDAVKNLPKKLLEIGKNLVTGLWNGISEKVTWLYDKVSGFVGGVVSKIKGFFGIKSPSRLMRDEVGRYLAEGVGEGISENEDAAIAPMQGIVDKIKGIDVAGEWGKLSDAGSSLNYDVSAQLGDYVSSAIDSNSPYALLGSLIDAVEDLASRAINLDIDGVRVATATAGASDNVSGSRLNLRNRGLAL